MYTFTLLCRIKRKMISTSFQGACKISTSSTVKYKNLAAFDFDNTIVEGFSDDQLINLLPKSVIPYYRNDGWLLYMQKIFKLLHAHDINETAIKNSVAQMRPIPGMLELIKELSINLNFDIIIISDANSYSINTWLLQHNFQQHIKKIFVNPAQFVGGMLKAENYHEQDWCNLSEPSLCKGNVLENFIKDQRDTGLTYKQIVYVGDGLNDFCPLVRLKCDDLACCREGFECAEATKASKAGKPIKGKKYCIQAELIYWNTGYDILNAVKMNVSKKDVCNFINK